MCKFAHLLEPPSYLPTHVQLKTWTYDGGLDIHTAFKLSGEPLAPQLAGFYGSGPRDQFTATDIAGVNIAKRDIQKEYMEYWNSTSELTSTGRPVDAVLCPLAPFPAARRGRFAYYGYSTWVNLLDYTAVVVPVTNVDKGVDAADKGYKPLGEEDKAVYEGCGFTQSFPSTVPDLLTAMQMIQRSMTVPMFLSNLWGGGFRRRKCWLLRSMWAMPCIQSRETATSVYEFFRVVITKVFKGTSL